MKQKILAIETSCDETSIAIIEYEGDPRESGITVLSHVILSQVELHKEYGGVYPSLAKREHAKNLVPVLDEALIGAGMKKEKTFDSSLKSKIPESLFAREPELEKQVNAFLPYLETPDIDAIAVTSEPGLEPTLWVGINFAKALALVWDKPLLPINHMEGHILAALLQRTESKKSEVGSQKYSLQKIDFPTLALLISGGHTELVLMKEWLSYEVIGETVDDAVGEAFDKTARMLDLPYPGGPEISKLAEQFTNKKPEEREIELPRPMIASGDYNFSFSGLKTAVKNTLHNYRETTPEIKEEVAYEFQEAAADVLASKTRKAVSEYNVKTFIAGGGVSANTRIREVLSASLREENPDMAIYLPPTSLTTDNALMIALTGALHRTFKPNAFFTEETMLEIKAVGTARLGA